MHPDTVIGVKLMIDILCLLIVLLRIYVMRKRALNRYQIATHICVFMCFASDFISHALFFEAMWAEKRFITAFNGNQALVDAQAVNVVFLNVNPSLTFGI
jgi:hypothetical protein